MNNMICQADLTDSEIAPNINKQTILLNEYSKSLKNITTKLDLLMSSLEIFFKQSENINKMLPIFSNTNKISLRIIDWFVTNYSKKFGTSYLIKDHKDQLKQFIVYLDYKSQLKAYSKKQFDPFCRRERIIFYYNDTDSIRTTVGQLNFFRWAIKNDILQYIQDHLEEIEQDMTQSVRKIYQKNKEQLVKKRRKRKEISISATKTINRHDVDIVINFD